jgi:hypothetical protein
MGNLAPQFMRRRGNSYFLEGGVESCVKPQVGLGGFLTPLSGTCAPFRRAWFSRKNGSWRKIDCCLQWRIQIINGLKNCMIWEQFFRNKYEVNRFAYFQTTRLKILPTSQIQFTALHLNCGARGKEGLGGDRHGLTAYLLMAFWRRRTTKKKLNTLSSTISWVKTVLRISIYNSLCVQFPIESENNVFRIDWQHQRCLRGEILVTEFQ